MVAARFLSALLFTASSGLSEASSTNSRPSNITGLVYHLYAWTGSYYNGTTTIRIEPQDISPDTECDTFVKTAEASYENSVLAIVKSDRSVPGNNDVTFALKYWDKSVNVVPGDLVYSNGPVNDITSIASVDLDEDRPDVQWRLNTSHLSATSYSFAGYRNDSVYNPPVRLNYSQCSTPDLAQYNGFLLQPGGLGDVKALNVTSYPTVSGRFDNQSASLEIRGVLDAKIYGSNLCGPVTISFLGQLDGNRSDELLSSSSDSPAWNPTLGYSKTLFRSSGAPSPAWGNGMSSWLYVAGALGCALWLL